MFGKLTLNNAASFRSFSTEEISQIEIWKNVDPKNVDGEISFEKSFDAVAEI